MKIDFDEKTLKFFDEFDETFNASFALLVNMRDEEKIVSKDTDKLLEKLHSIYNSLLDWKKDLTCVLINNAILKAKEEED